MKIKRNIGIIIAILAALLLSTTALAISSDQITVNGNIIVFSDVPSDYWAKSQIDYFSQQGIVSGYEDGSFKPENGVTREEYCKLLVSTFNQSLETPNTRTFSDVSEDRWSYSYVEFCKEFLTGYSNPFGGLPSFHPDEYATREDIAVSLVRMMGYTEDDANDKNYAKWKFKDGDMISPSLIPYVSIACEKGLINGYPDGTFGPTNGITRAETVVLLNRATKQAVTDINADLELDASVAYSTDKKTATIHITAEQGTTVTVNGESVKLSKNYSGKYEGNYVYKFTSEGSKKFEVVGVKAGKTKTVNLTATYEIAAPNLTLGQCDQTVTDKYFSLSGYATDENSSVKVTINGKQVGVTNYSGYWCESYELSEGDNCFEVIATNEAGKKTTKSIVVTYTVGAPKLTLNEGSQTVTSKRFSLSGYATDENYSVKVTINGEQVDKNNYSGYWSSKTYTLTEGENYFEIIAANEIGKQTTKSITVTYTVGAPELTLKQDSQTVTNKMFSLSGYATDENYSVKVTINGEQVNNINSYNGYWCSKTYILSEGENYFEIIATNENGKQSTESITVTYTPEE